MDVKEEIQVDSGFGQSRIEGCCGIDEVNQDPEGLGQTQYQPQQQNRDDHY